MLIWRRWWNRLSIYPKLVMSFLIIILPVITISFSMNAMGAKTIQTEIAKSMSTSARQYLNLIVVDLNRALKQQRDYINNPDLMNLAFKSQVMTDIDKTTSIIRLQQQLQLYKSENAFIEDAVLFIPAIERTISANNGSVQIIAQDRYNAMKAAASHSNSPLFLWENELYMNLSYPDGLSLTGQTEPLFVLSLELSKSGLLAALSELQIGRSGGAALVLFQNDWFISKTEDGSFNEQFKAYLLNQKNGAASGVLPALHQNNQKFMVVMEKTPSFGGIAMIAFAKESEILGPIEKYKIWFWALCFLSMMAVAVFSYWIYKWIHQPLRKLVRAFNLVEQGNLKVTVPTEYHDEFGYLFSSFNGMVVEIKRLIQEVYEKNYRLQLSEFRQLQSQINPHFLYNSFFIIYRMAKQEQNQEVMRMTQYLGEYFQFITRNASDEVTLKEELTHARNYVDIQSIRFNNRIHADFEEIPFSANAIYVPRLIIQPIIENVYQHAFRNKLADGYIKISYLLNLEDYCIEVEDNSTELSEELLKQLNTRMRASDFDLETTGMINVHRRLQIKYGESGGLNLSRSVFGGLKVTITIPLQGRDPNAEHDRH